MSKSRTAMRDESPQVRHIKKKADEIFPPIHPAWSGTENEAFQSGAEAGASSLIPLLMKACEALEWYMKNTEVCFFEFIGGDGAPGGYVPYQGNWDFAHKTIAEIESEVRGKNE